MSFPKSPMPIEFIFRSCRLRQPLHSSYTRIRYLSQQQHQLSICGARQFSHSNRLSYPRKDSQHKDSINTEATEYSKSATDDESARQGDSAFDPDITNPQHAKDVAEQNKGVRIPYNFLILLPAILILMFLQDTNNPLDVSPANPEVSKSRPKQEGGSQNSSASSNATSDRERSSGGGSPSKGKQVS